MRERAQDPAFAAQNYGVFLRGHKRALVRYRYFTKEWPADIVAAIADKSVAEVLSLPGDGNRLPQDADLPMFELIADWYCLRQGASLALPHIEPERLALYRTLAKRFGRVPENHDGSVESFIGVFLGAMGLFLDRADAGTRRLTVPLSPIMETVPA